MKMKKLIKLGMIIYWREKRNDLKIALYSIKAFYVEAYYDAAYK
jgi:hypothetical protein